PSVARLRTWRSEVSRSSMKTAVRPSGPTVSERGRTSWAIASSRQSAGGGTSLRSGTGIPPRSSLPIHMRSTGSGSGTRRSLLDPGERLSHQGPDRGQVVAALLHEDGRQAERAERAAAGTVAVRGHPKRALRIARGGVDAESDHEGVGMPVPGEPREVIDRLEPLGVAGPRGQR